MGKPRQYDPDHNPDPAWWLNLDEGERMLLVEKYHRRHRIELPNERLHAIIHAIVENQVAAGAETPVAAKLDSLIEEGLDRHEAIHAIGSVLSTLLWDLQQGPLETDTMDEYHRRLESFTAERWLAEFANEDSEAAAADRRRSRHKARPSRRRR